MTGRQLELDLGVPDVALLAGHRARPATQYTTTFQADRPDKRVYLWWRGRHRRVRIVTVISEAYL